VRPLAPKIGIFYGHCPGITRARPFSKQLLDVAMSRMPNRRVGLQTLHRFRIASNGAGVDGVPANAPFRSTRLQPCAARIQPKACACAQDPSLNTLIASISPWTGARPTVFEIALQGRGSWRRLLSHCVISRVLHGNAGMCKRDLTSACLGSGSVPTLMAVSGGNI